MVNNDTVMAYINYYGNQMQVSCATGNCADCPGRTRTASHRAGVADGGTRIPDGGWLLAVLPRSHWQHGSGQHHYHPLCNAAARLPGVVDGQLHGPDHPVRLVPASELEGGGGVWGICSTAVCVPDSQSAGIRAPPPFFLPQVPCNPSCPPSPLGLHAAVGLADAAEGGRFLAA